MKIHNIKITNFKSIYETQEINFDNLSGLVKLSGPIGVGKTTLAEAILWGLYGSVKKQTNTGLVAWNTKTCEVEINLTSNNKEIHIIRNLCQPLIIEVDGKVVAASDKRGTQSILEEELLDIPKLAVERMCIISFNNFNSIANMSPGETKAFLDNIFEFKVFSLYNNEIMIERKTDVNESIKLKAIYDETLSEIKSLQQKKYQQQQRLTESIDIDALTKKRKQYIDEGVNIKQQRTAKNDEMNKKILDIKKQVSEYQNKMTEVATLGRVEKIKYNNIKSGICPTCGHVISTSEIEEHKLKMMEYANQYKTYEQTKKQLDENIIIITNEYNKAFKEYDKQIAGLKENINNIDISLQRYTNETKIISQNYDDLISEYNSKCYNIKKKLDICDTSIQEWNQMSDLFSKTLRYNLISKIIPQINKSISFFINKLEQQFRISFDEEFKSHIKVDTYDKEISYNNLSTGQKKSLDLAIIFGILHTIISNIDMNILILDELFSNMDSDTRNIMLNLLNETISKDKVVFIINHAEMADDYFNNKIRVSLKTKTITSDKKDVGNVNIKMTQYEQIF